jgi:hypothetical protein
MAHEEFDRSLFDFRNDVARANVTLRDSIECYIAMMNAIEAAFLLFYEDLTPDEQMKLRAAFYKLADAVRVSVPDDGPSNVHPIKKDT